MKLHRSYCFALFAACFLFSFSNLIAQIQQPEPYNLSNGNYEFNEWASSNSPETYPSNTLLRVTDGRGSAYADPNLSIQMNYVYTHSYNATSGSRIEGQAGNGISFFNIGTGISSNDSAIAGRFVGAMDLGLISTGRDSIKITWTGRTINTSPREYRIALQYRIGIYSDWLSLGDEYIRNEISGHFEQIGPILLPEICNNQPKLQLRWRYYYVETGAGGARPKLAVDNITVESKEISETEDHIIELSNGWNYISSYVSPLNPNINQIFDSNLSSLNLIKNNDGKLFTPQFGINEIETWNLFAGLMVYTNQADELNISGFELIPQHYSLYLTTGRNLVPYLRKTSLDIETALSSVMQNIMIVNNSRGGIFNPSFGINSIGEMQAGEGYLIYFSAASLLTYPGN